MSSTKTKEIFSFSGTIISGLADLKSILDKAEVWVIVLCSILFCLFLIYFLTLHFKSWFDFINGSLETDTSNQEFAYFRNLSTHLIIDIDDNFQDAKFLIRRKVECMKLGANTYKYLFSPFSKFQNFETNIGFLTIVESEGAADILLTLDKPYSKGEEVDLELTQIAKNIFENTDNFWLLPKAYEGKEVVKIEIILPKNANVTSYNADILVNHDKRERKPLRNPPYKDLQNDRIVLIAKTMPNELKVGQKLAVKWKY